MLNDDCAVELFNGAICMCFSCYLQDFTRAAFHFKLHSFIQLFTFLIMPLFMSAIATILKDGPFDDLLLKG